MGQTSSSVMHTVRPSVDHTLRSSWVALNTLYCSPRHAKRAYDDARVTLSVGDAWESSCYTQHPLVCNTLCWMLNNAVI